MHRILLLGAAALMVTMLACSNSSTKNAPAGQTVTTSPTLSVTATAGQVKSIVNASLKEFSITPDRNAVSSGQVTFRGQNTGTVAHDLIVVKTDADPASLPMVSDGSKVDESKIDKVLSLTNIDAGKSSDGDVRLAPGKYVLLCNQPAHYKSGMVTAFTVTP